MATTPLPGFIDIGPQTSIFTPENPVNGELIILCTWLGAGRRHIAKYVALHQRVAPHTRILLIESAVSCLTSSYAKQRRDIQPAASVVVDTVIKCGYISASDESSTSKSKLRLTSTTTPMIPRILLQTFSNGGANTATQLLIVLRERLQAPLPLAGLICDSGPAKLKYWKLHEAMVLALPKDAISRLLGALVCHCILIALYSWMAIGNESPTDLQRRVVLDSHYVREASADKDDEKALGVNSGRRACYLYSKADPICPWVDLSEHAEEARSQGWRVEEVVFEDSGHCAHYQKHEKQYVDSIKAMWEGQEST